MFLKRLEIQGFKSFANKTVVDFEKGITGIVGPNGSGKSNISDAIRWVLGEQSAKTLRGSKMEDIIFSGTSKRKPLGFGEVTLVLDNKDGMIPIDYSDVSITRRVFRSGESEYYINKSTSRLKDIKELFMDTGVGTDGYSIIGQGKIDEILSTKSEDRRNLFEEATGIVKYKSRKQQSEKKLQKTQDNLIRINDIIQELDNQIIPLKEQSRKAKEYLNLKDSLKELEVNLFVREINRLKEQIKHLDQQKELVNKQLNFNDEKKNEIEKKYEKVKNTIDEMEKELENIQSEKQNIQSQLEKKESDLKLSYEKITFFEREVNRLKNEIKENNDYISNKKSKLNSLIKNKEEINSIINSAEQGINEKEKILHEKEKDIKKKENIIEEKKSKVIDLLNYITEKKGKINTIQSFNKNIDKRIEQLKQEIQEIKTKKTNISDKINNLKNEIKNKNNEVDKLEKNKIELNENILDIKNKIDKTSEILNDLKGKIQEKKSKLKMLQNMKEGYEGYYKGVKNTLLALKKNKTLGKGVKGVVAELIEVDSKLEKSIEIALGSSVQNIVTDTQENAQNIINYLKKNKLGRVTFLPISSIRGRNLNNREIKVLKEDGVLGVASELISYSDEFVDIFKYLLGRVLIVKDLETGIKISKKINYSLKIVSLDGDVLNPGGSMTGGSYKSFNNQGLIGRDREIKTIKKNVDKLVKDFNERVESYNSDKEKLKTYESNLEDNNEKLNNSKVELSNLKNKVINHEEQLEDIELTINKFQKEQNNLEKEKEESEEQVQHIKDEIDNLESENDLTKGDIKEEISVFENKKTEKQSLEKEITQSKIEKASNHQKKNDIISSISTIEEEIRETENKDDLINDELINKEKGIDKTKEFIKELNKKKEELKEEFSLKNSKLIDIKNKRSLYIDSFYKEQENLKKMNDNINGLQQSVNTMEIKFAKYEVQLDNFNNKLWEEYELTYEDALKIKKDIDNVTKVQNDIREIKKKIKVLGNINLDSIDEYEQVSERHEFLKGQKDDLTDAKESLKKVITDMESKMQDQFISNFKIVRENFSEIFKKLFGGGNADVYLVDKENILSSGIEIIAQPPGKKLQNISLLSGGEKALTAIALLFAILKLKPTPFCVLDEIEAALDDANVIRFADYLHQFTHKTQFIVITHRKGTMESVDSLYGVTMEESGISKLISVKLSELIKEKAS